MKIQDLLIETDLSDAQLDEAGFAQGLGNAAQKVGKAVGAVQGGWQGVKQQFGQGKQAGVQAGKAAVTGQGQPAQTPVQQAQQAQTAPAQQGQIEPTMDPVQAAPAQAAPADTTAVNPGVATSDETSAQANQTTTNVAAAGSRIGAPAGKQAVDNAIKTVGAVRSDRRQGVIDYAQQKLDQAEQELAAIRKNAGIKQQAQPNLQVQQGGKAPAPAPQQAVA